MKNHFVFSYIGNKREEVEKIYKCVEDKLENIETIIEPFCGSSAFSYYVSTLHPKRFKYILNDLHPFLIELYRTLQDEQKTFEMIRDLKLLYHTHDKILYKSICKYTKNKTFLGYVLAHCSHSIIPGLFDIRTTDINKIHAKMDKMLNAPILHFLRTEDITFLNTDGFEVYKEKAKDESCLLFLDPTYLISDNTQYDCNSQDLYKYLFYNNIKNEIAFVVLCLEYSWIIELLFPNPTDVYEKRYRSHKGNTTRHGIMINK